MHDAECVSFLQWALPRMGFRWSGYRKVRGQVCKRIGRRLRELGLGDLQEYRRYLENHPDEWRKLEDRCRITISRFSRDRVVFRILTTEILPSLARQAQEEGQTAVRIWSAGCGAGEEPYSLAILTQGRDELALSRISLKILATDADGHQIQRARTALYRASSLRELSPAVLELAFDRVDADSLQLRERFRGAVEFRQQDLQSEMPEGPFHLILCRNLAFTYFDLEHQRQILAVLLEKLLAGGYLVIGSHERLSADEEPLSPLPDCPCILGPLPTAATERG